MHMLTSTAVWRRSGVTALVAERVGELVGVERNIPADGADGESTELGRARNRLLACPSGRWSSSADCDRVGYMIYMIDERCSACRCVVSRLCQAQLEYQSVNPTTQVALFAGCLPSCSSSSVMNVTWTVYQGTLNVTSNTTQWTRYAPMSEYENVWFFGESFTTSCPIVDV